MRRSQTIQDWDKSVALGAKGVEDISHFLCGNIVKDTWLNTELVCNVEQDNRFRPLDIDLLWVVPIGDSLQCLTIEVKTDRNRHTGNFFFETVSVEASNKLGAFLITRAEWLFYYFIDAGELFCLPMEEVRPWFLKHIHEFREKQAYSNNQERKNTWSTRGRTVPISRVVGEIPSVRTFQKRERLWDVLGRENCPSRF